MNLSVLLDQYRNSPRLFQLADRLSFADLTPTLPQGEGEKQKIFLKNLRGSSAEFVVSSVFMHERSAALNHLVVLNDAEEAAYFQNTVENLTNALDIF